ncbi:hypothetical protein [Flavisolibacter nicotianae]|uniref:hypothetical protein n=1 Tax=Flavisolibacter nicotianae TaxID=2364882 RepID=UPI000EB0F211|nr:hypothetical protein [Flavisolibacter nicotianae]
MAYRKLSTLHKWYLKYTNRSAYIEYKRSLQDYAFYHKTIKLQHPSLAHAYKALTSFKHSGNSGDIIYALPAVFELSKNGKAILYLHVEQQAEYSFNYHPLGNVMLSEKMISLLKPLLLYQPQIEKVEIYKGEPVDYDLDEFRKYSFHLDRGSITRWYFNVYGISYDTSQPWLRAPKDAQYANNIVIARSHRYRSPLIDYSFLKAYPNKLFVGVKEEYEDMKKALPDLVYQPVNDFLEMATIINSCRLFIGNQSFPFALAEALKVTRLLEVYYKLPNVVVEGRGANDFIYQPQFEYAVRRLLEE